MAFRWPQPDTEQAFEAICLEVLKVEWQCPTLELYAKRGEMQYGIDIIDPAARRPFRVAQCKLREPHKKLTKAEILAELEKLKSFPGGQVDHYLILTTASRSGAGQNAVIEINRERAGAGLSPVEVRGWDWIESVIEAHPSLMERTHPPIVGAVRKLVQEEVALERATLTQLVSQLRLVASADAKPARPNDGYDDEIDEARRLLDGGDAQVARVLLQRLRDRAWEELTAHQKFRVATNLGVSYMRTDDRGQVAELLIEGASYEPHTEKSGVNRAIGLELRGESDAAYAAAEAVFQQFPSSAAALAARIRNAPAATPWQELTGWVTADLGADTTVGMALAMSAMQLGRPDDAMEWAARAVAGADELSRAQSLVVQGHATIRAALRHASFCGGELPEDDRSRLSDSIALLSDAIDSLGGRIPTLAGEAYAHRSRAHDFLGDQARAAQDADEAERLAPDSPNVLVCASERDLAAKKWNNAVTNARRAIKLHAGPFASHLLVRALWSRNESGDRVEAAEVLVALTHTKGLSHLSAAVHEATTALCGVGRVEDAWGLLGEMNDALGLAAHTHRASLAIRAGDIDRAKIEVEHALEAGWENLERTDQRRLATALLQVGWDANALPILTALHRPGRLDRDTQSLLDCAFRLGRHELVMEASAALRGAGVRDPRVLRNELNLLERYSPSQALEVLLSLTQEDPTNREARLELSVVALRVGRSDLISTAPADLPLAEQATPEATKFVVEILRQAGEGRRAIEYAYTVLRRHFRDPEAHRQFVFATLGSYPPAERKRVEPHTAVRFRDETTRRERWLVVEPVDANPELEEEGPDGPVASKLLGHEVGDTVLVASGAAQDRFATILEIVENITFRFRDSLSEWQIRFPDEQGFEMIQLARPGAPPDSEDLDFEPMLRMVREKHASIEKLDAAYLSTPMLPVFMLSGGQGTSEVETWGHVVQTGVLPVRCCLGTQEEWEGAIHGAQSCRGVVLDVGAVLAVDWLELRDVLAAWPVQRLITHATMRALRAHKAELERGAPRAQDPNRDAAIAHLDEFLRFLSKTCEEIDTPELAAVPGETRENLLSYLGPSSTESIAAATLPGRVLWSDQVAAGLLGRGALGVAQVWTQAVVHGRHAVGALSDERLANIDARLLALRYVTTRFGERAIVAGAVAAGWDTKGFPLKQTLDDVVGVGVQLHDRLWVIIRSIVAMCTEAATPEVRSSVIIALLERMALRPAGFAAIRAVRRALCSAFGVNALRAEEADEVIAGWLAAHGKLDE